MKKVDPLASIIVPVYNVEKYLRDCIESILRQTYSNFELILVDDGSPDSCGEICDAYGRLDDRIKVVHKENGGLSDARNCGIRLAQGEYISFCDGDDMYGERYLELLLHAAVEYDADLVAGKYSSQMEEIGTGHGIVKIFNTEDAFREYLKMGLLGDCAWAKLYKKSIFGEISYPVGRINEDTCTTYKLILNSKKIIYISDIIYFYRINPEGIMRSPFSEKRLEILSVPDEMLIYLGKRAEIYKEELDYYKMRLFIWVYNLSICAGSNMDYTCQQKYMYDTLMEINTDNKYINLKYHILLHIMRYFPKVYDWLAFLSKGRR